MRWTAVVGGVLAATVAAQNIQYYDGFNFNQVDIDTRTIWCSTQMTTCETLCRRAYNAAETNRCEASNLDYQCDCDDGSSPDLPKFNATLPTFQCHWLTDRCVEDSDGDPGQIMSCKIERACGTLDPATAYSDDTTSTPSSTPSPTSTPADAPASDSSTPEPSSSSNNIAIYVAIPILGVLLIIAVIVGFVLFRKNRKRRTYGNSLSSNDIEVTEQRLNFPRKPELDGQTNVLRLAEASSTPRSPLVTNSNIATSPGGFSVHSHRSEADASGQSTAVRSDSTAGRQTFELEAVSPDTHTALSPAYSPYNENEKGARWGP